MPTLKRKRRLQDAYAFPGFRPETTIRGVFGDPKARVITLIRRSKKTACGTCGQVHSSWYDRKTRWVRDLSCGDTRVYLEFEVRWVHCRICGKVKREKLDFLADDPLHTQRFAWYVGRRCRATSIKDVAKELMLDWHTVKAIEKQYMAAQLASASTPGPKAIGYVSGQARQSGEHQGLEAGAEACWHRELPLARSLRHVQAGTPLHVLQELGGWESVEMVRQYAHISSEHLAEYVDRMSGGLRIVKPGNEKVMATI